MRNTWATYNKQTKDNKKQKELEKDEKELKQKVNSYTLKASGNAKDRIEAQLGKKVPKEIRDIIQDAINESLPIMGIKKKVDSQKKRILISQTKQDKTLSDIIYKMLSFNGVPDSDIIYTNSDNADCRVPNRMNIFDYLRTFFVDSISDGKMFVIYVTSEDMAKAWGAVSEVGAGWITQSSHDIFTLDDHEPQEPLNVRAEWQTSKKEGNNIVMTSIEFDKFIVKIIDICKDLGYALQTKSSNEKELKRYVTVE
jgi:hypothetical protein